MMGLHRRPSWFRANTPRRKRRTLLGTVMVAVLLAGLGIPSIASAGDVAADFDWSMPDRTHWNNEYRSVDVSPPSREYLSPTSWPVTLNACGSRGAPIAMHWEINMGDHVEVIDRPWTSASCTVDVSFPALGEYSTTLTVRSILGGQSSVTWDVLVRDFLVVSIGDSVASGEGNPDVPGPPLWYDRPCHRSGKSGAARAALKMEQQSARFSVTLLALGCSGATIPQGLMGDYPDPPERDSTMGPVPSQVKVVGWQLCPANVTCNSKADIRPIDALVVNIGGNDIHFGDIVFDCAIPVLTPCYADDDITDQLAEDFAALPRKLDALAGMMDDWLRYRNVYVNEYFDPAWDENHKLCTMDISAGTITPAEAGWASKEVIEPLNGNLWSAVNRHRHLGWNYVGGISEQFGTHGYCAGSPPNGRWIVTYDQSQNQQGNEKGTMHPNWWGHEAYANTLLNAWLHG